MKSIDHRIGIWERNGTTVGWLLFVVFFLGLLVATLQAATTRTMKIGAATLSFASAMLVAYYHQFFPADDRAYHKLARQARSRLNAFSYELAQYSSLDESTKASLHKKFGQLIADIDDMENSTIYSAGGGAVGGGTVSSSHLDFILLPTAWADQLPADGVRPPAWAENLPNDDRNFYYVGVTEGKTFEDARDKALLKARNDAVDRFVKAAKGSAQLADKSELIAELAKALAGSAEVAETFVAPEPTGGFRGYVLLRLSRSAAAFTARSIFVQARVHYDDAFLNKIKSKD